MSESIKSFLIALAAGACFALAGYSAAHIAMREQEVEPTFVLVGEACEGDSYIAVGREEDSLPRCASITVHEVR